MKENNVKAVDPAEVCECNPEWSNAPGDNDWDECRCSIVQPVEKKENDQKEEES